MAIQSETPMWKHTLKGVLRLLELGIPIGLLYWFGVNGGNTLIVVIALLLSVPAFFWAILDTVREMIDEAVADPRPMGESPETGDWSG